MTTTSVTDPTIARISRAAGSLVQGLHEIRMALIEGEGGTLDDDRVQLLRTVKDAIHLALGTENCQGIMDLLGMRLFEKWIAAAFVDGSYGEHVIYRYDGEARPLFSARELDDADGSSYWHVSEDHVAAHLILKCGARPGLAYVPARDTET